MHSANHRLLASGYHGCGSRSGRVCPEKRLDHNRPAHKGARRTSSGCIFVCRRGMPFLCDRCTGVRPARNGHRTRRRGHHQCIYLYRIGIRNRPRGGDPCAVRLREGCLPDRHRCHSLADHPQDQGGHSRRCGRAHGRLRPPARSGGIEKRPVPSGNALAGSLREGDGPCRFRPCPGSKL